jgi:hypothetical protein
MSDISYYTLARSGAVFKADMDNEAETLDTFKWDWKGGDWVESDQLMEYLLGGDPDLESITDEQAEKMTGDEPDDDPDDVTLVSKAVGTQRFTLGPMYIPDRLDAHGEWTDPDELQKAVWDYVDSGDRRIRLQHDTEVVAGRWLEVMTWPYPVEVPLMRKDAGTRTVTFPANTAFLGVQWEPWAWELVEKGLLRGYSIGGKAERLLVDLPSSDADLH